MKTIHLMTASFCVAAVNASAADLSVSAKVEWESDYIYRGVRLADDIVAPSVGVTYGNFYGGVWSAHPLDSAQVPGEIESETDFYGGFGTGLTEWMSGEIGFTFYTYSGDFEDTFELFAGLSLEVPYSPAVFAHYDFDLDTFTLEASSGYTIEIEESQGVEFSLHLGYVDTDGSEDYVYYGAGTAYNYTIVDYATATLGVNYYATQSDAGLVTNSGSSKFTLTASFSAGF